MFKLLDTQYINLYSLPRKTRKELRKKVRGLKSTETQGFPFLGERYIFELPILINGKKGIVFNVPGDKFKIKKEWGWN